MINTRLLGNNNLISNKREWNNCFIKNNQEILLDLADFALQEQPEDNLMATISRAWYKAELLNSHLKSIFSESSPMKLKHAANAAVRNILADQTNHPIMPSITITVNGIWSLLTKVNLHKAPGPDKLHPLVLKELSSSIAPALCRIFKASLESGVVTSDWKSANVTLLIQTDGRKL